MSLRVWLAFVCYGLGTWLVPAQSASEPLKDIPSIRSLQIEPGYDPLPFDVVGTVTFYHPDWGVLFIHDGKDGICVGVPLHGRPEVPFVVGQRLHIVGSIGPGEFLPVLLPAAIEDAGQRTAPSYPHIEGESLFTPALDARPVEVEAIVKGTSFTEMSLVLDLQVDGWPIRAIVPQPAAPSKLPWELLEQRVRVQGVVGTHFNDQRQMSGRLLFVPGLDSIVRVQEETNDTEAPLVQVDSVLRVHSPPRQRVRIQGQATHVIPGSGLYLRGQGGSVFVQTAQPLDIRRHDEVEAEGFPVVTLFRPSLSAINVRRLTEKSPVEPLELKVDATRNSAEQCELVHVEAELLEVTPGREAHTLLCRNGHQIFQATLSNDFTLPKDLVPGTTLSLTGICELVSTRPLVIPRNATSFRILLRDLEDITITARQPWWNEQRAVWLLGAIGVLALAIAAWAVALQTMVHKQSSVIRKQTEQQATLEERQRIARDLHDTLEQELVGVSMLLDNAATRTPNSPVDTSTPLDLARRLLKRARDESRSTIRDLRSVTLEQRGLPAALEEVLRPLATMGGAQFHVKVEGQPVRLPGTVETHILRLAQEAVSNAARHSQATCIEVHLSYLPESLTLTVQDDGIGFDTTASVSPTSGHFGLSGMKERADKIRSILTIHSTPGDTRVILCVPTRAHTRMTPRNT
jgi:signal transduction histidine kinase